MMSIGYNSGAADREKEEPQINLIDSWEVTWMRPVLMVANGEWSLPKEAGLLDNDE